MIRHLVVSSRPLSWINTAYPFALAYLLLARPVDPLVLVVGTLYFLVPYNLAMYGINDVFDYESDLRNPRKGGVEGAVLAPALHRPTLVAAAVTNVPFLVVLVLLGGWASWIVLAISVFAVIAYSAPVLRFKERPVLDSITSATHFVSPAVYGLALAGAAPRASTVLVLVAFFCWGMASHAFGAVQDIPADREAGIGSVATVLGARATVVGSAVLYLAAGVLAGLSGWPVALAGLLAIPYLVMVLPFVGITDATAEQANRGWRRFLAINYGAGFGVTVLAIVASAVAAS
ncbi:prenyltransferase [Amnibacterium kyonggiense]|uniref:4-hydroxybenzoate polyprenyltransferase n=1 Tax=Amnibacterium kyonggiense TaxID=595671 RepID=A0A4R7FQ77_9MICO|nr:prenyltransferase [Amnibacterium kyonggiense]TDS79883.1 4-hydroxybenzoate polyprenyltransferase [Amnibacterium kyonggiense]